MKLTDAELCWLELHAKNEEYMWACYRDPDNEFYSPELAKPPYLEFWHKLSNKLSAERDRRGLPDNGIAAYLQDLIKKEIYG